LRYFDVQKVWGVQPFVRCQCSGFHFLASIRSQEKLQHGRGIDDNQR